MLIRTHEDPGVERSVLIVALYFFCALAFGIDVTVELALEFHAEEPLSYVQTVHLALELLAEAALILAVILSFQSYLRLRATSKHAHDVGHAIRTGFDKILVDRFRDWNLTKSEREIAILAIRGLGIVEIAAHRKTKEGTIKSHLHNVYAKASVGSRSDLLAMLMDELLHSHELSVDPRQTSSPTGQKLHELRA